MNLRSARRKFVVFEGADGSGKSLLADRLCTQLQARGETVARVSRVRPYGLDVYADLVASVSRIFRIADEIDSPLPLLALAAATQHATIFESQVRPALEQGSYVVADSWWAKTQVRFAVEARRCTDWNKSDQHRFDDWLSTLARFSQIGHDDDVVTVLVDSSTQDRIHWYRRLDVRQEIYDRRGRSTTDPTVFGEFTNEIQERLRIIAQESQWQRVENREGKDETTTVEEIIATVEPRA